MICKVCAYLTHLSTLDCVGYMLCNAIVCKAYIDVLFGSAIIFCFHYCLCVNAIWRCWAILFTISVVYQCIKLFFTQLARQVIARQAYIYQQTWSEYQARVRKIKKNQSQITVTLIENKLLSIPNFLEAVIIYVKELE